MYPLGKSNKWAIYLTTTITVATTIETLVPSSTTSIFLLLIFVLGVGTNQDKGVIHLCLVWFSQHKEIWMLSPPTSFSSLVFLCSWCWERTRCSSHSTLFSLGFPTQRILKVISSNRVASFSTSGPSVTPCPVGTAVGTGVGTGAVGTGVGTGVGDGGPVEDTLTVCVGGRGPAPTQAGERLI